MFKRYRDIVLATGLAGAAALGVGIAWHFLETGQPEFPEDPEEQRIEADYHPGGSSCDPSAIGPFPAGEPLSKGKTCKDAREEHRLNANDLIQQRRAANAASTAAYLSHFQTLLGILGMAFGFLTFVAAFAAARYAKRAAIATERTVDTTTNVGNTQLRAWLYFDSHEIQVMVNDDGLVGAVRFIFSAKNCGSTPARDVYINAGHEIDAIPKVNAVSLPLGSGVAVGPGESVRANAVFLEPKKIMSVKGFYASAVYIRFALTYRDIFYPDIIRTTIKSVRLVYTGTMDVGICDPNLLTPGHFEINASGENIMT